MAQQWTIGSDFREALAQLAPNGVLNFRDPVSMKEFSVIRKEMLAELMQLSGSKLAPETTKPPEAEA